MKERPHALPSFSAWLNKGFDLRSHAHRMSDARTGPDILPPSVFLALFYIAKGALGANPVRQIRAGQFALQLLEAGKAEDKAVLPYSLCGFDLDSLQAMLVDVNRRLKRGKAFDQGRVQGRLVAALDGIEVLSSYSRRCENCLERRVIRKDQAGRKIEETQYYRRAVGCQMVYSPVKPFLDIEWL